MTSPAMQAGIEELLEEAGEALVAHLMMSPWIVIIVATQAHSKELLNAAEEALGYQLWP